ncbi:protein-disulfide isomerase [Knoellia remsis]|uniref:Protein-disulfide isomerase n=1 Tax=Knoellia remsis TaxID=407159 RepID=A0A2T0UMY6_9MICO|nr:thioredoxin domain-containing protein [Knoellia remsis]PRY59293.1 protein-disulfide isomerase [Knoellia remsis]
MNRNVKITAILTSVIAIAALVVGVVLLRPGSGDDGADAAAKGGNGENVTIPTAPAPADPQALRPDTYRLSTAPNDKVNLVEFLDFECEACGALYPLMEELRTKYDGKVTFGIRYFPITSHFNAERAARAVEAAAQQGEVEAMYKKMYDTQKQWAEQQEPKDDLFRSYAEEIGLDMKAYDKAYTSQQTLDRIAKDVAEGKALGVQGTPTLFLNGKKLEPKSGQDLVAAIDKALAQ